MREFFARDELLASSSFRAPEATELSRRFGTVALGPDELAAWLQSEALMPIFLYIERATFIHRLHPTVKVFALFVMFWSVYWVDHPLALLPLGLVMLALAEFTGAWPNFYRLRWLFILVILTTTLAWMVFYRQGPALINLPLIHLSRASLVFGLGRGLKLAELLATSVLFLSTTKVEEFTAGLARLGVPYRVGFAITLSFRLVPLFIDSALTVVQAQNLRGYDFNRGGPLERVKRYVPVLIPVFMGALRKANSMAMALEARGFGMSRQPTSFIDYPVEPSDIAATVALFALGAVYFMIYYTGYGAISPK